MPRFEWWFGEEIDLNQPAEGENVADSQDAGTSAVPTSGGAPDVPGPSASASGGPGTRSAARTGVTLSSEDSDGDEEEVQSTPEGFVPKTPFVGMMFDTLEAALAHYNRYAKNIGFSVKIQSSRKSAKDGEKDKSVFVCNKSGKLQVEEETALQQRNRTLTKQCECKAKLRVKRDGARWEVTQFVEEHTHELIQKFQLKKYMRSHKKIPKEEKKFIELLHEVNLSSGRIMSIMAELYGGKKNVPYDSKTVSNYTATLAEDTFRDIPELLDYFEELKKEDPRFYYKYKLDAASRVERIFWVDGAARDAYKLYNDCISFDTTYLTNKWKMPCAPFIGINRYGQSIQLGCGFVRNEKIEDFVWLFEKFLDAMDGLHPDNIITDQCGAMKSAILTLLAHTVHRNCRWHIMQKVQEKLGPFIAKREELRKDFNEVIDYSLTVEEFETKWAEMLVKHDVAGNQHLLDLYDLRECFVPAYFQGRFFPFLQTTARSEGFNAVLKKYVNPHASLLRFFKRFMKLQEQIDVTEDANEFVDEDKTVRTWCDFPMEKQMLKTYTMPLYKIFRSELSKITSYNTRDCGSGLFEVFPVHGSVFCYGRRSYIVQVDRPNEIYNCQCGKFQKDGILCCHALKVMSYLSDVQKMPARYILPRWSRPPPDIVVPSVVPQERTAGKLTRKDMRVLRYGNLCTDFAKLAVGFAASDKTKEIADKHMKAMEKELEDMKRVAAEAAKRRKKGKSTEEAIDVDKEGVDVEQEVADAEREARLAENKKARDPLVAPTRGRPASKRKRSGLQLQKPYPTNCGVCNEKDHDARNCPVRLANPEKYPLLALFQTAPEQ